MTYTESSLSGKLLREDMHFGIIAAGKIMMMAVKIRVITGQHKHPIWIIDPNLCTEAYAWYLSMQETHVDFVNLYVSGSLFSSKDTSIVVANDITWHADPRTRKVADKNKMSLMNGTEKTKEAFSEDFHLPETLFQPAKNTGELPPENT